jgi:hypothetical protein
VLPNAPTNISEFFNSILDIWRVDIPVLQLGRGQISTRLPDRGEINNFLVNPLFVLMSDVLGLRVLPKHDPLTFSGSAFRQIANSVSPERNVFPISVLPGNICSFPWTLALTACRSVRQSLTSANCCHGSESR